MKCPRCGGKLVKEQDPDYGWCLIDGTVFIGQNKMDKPEPIPTRKVEKVK